jgi:hypothetical protein
VTPGGAHPGTRPVDNCWATRRPEPTEASGIRDYLYPLFQLVGREGPSARNGPQTPRSGTQAGGTRGADGGARAHAAATGNGEGTRRGGAEGGGSSSRVSSANPSLHGEMRGFESKRGAPLARASTRSLRGQNVSHLAGVRGQCGLSGVRA